MATTDLRIPRSAPRAVGLTHARPALAGLAAAAGTIHLVAVVEHLGAEWELAAFFALVGIAQLAAAWVIYRNGAGERLLKLVALGSVAVALLWVFSRTTGVPFAPEAGTVAKVGVGDTIATLLELAFAAIVALIVSRGEQSVTWLSSAIGTRLTIAVLSLSLMLGVFGGHEH